MRSSAPSIQDQTRKSLLHRASNTEPGRRYAFANITTHRQYADQIPLTNYENIKDDIRRMMNGESDVLWSGDVKWYAKSSGTTDDRSKYLPVTEHSLYRNNVAASWDSMAILYHEDPACQVFHKKSLIMGGAIAPWEGNPDVTVGDISAILLHRMPAVGRPFYSPDFTTACLPDWEDKIVKMSKICVDNDIVMFGGVPTWTIVLFNRILEQTGANNMLEVWPDVKYYFHGGVGFAPYVDQFAKYFPDPKFRYFEVYNASEGYFAVQDRTGEPGMLLFVDNDIYYEFIPIDQLSDEHPESLPIAEVKIGQHYAIVISTSAGLWRYMPGDTVTFTSLAPYRILVSGRTKHFINVFGEEVMVGNTDRALAETISILPAKVSDYTVAPVYMAAGSKGGHQWLIEFEEEPADLDGFAKLLDDNLKQINSDYAAKRYKDMALVQLEILPLPAGTFFRWLASKGKVGGQNKVPRLYNTRKYVDELLKFSAD